MGGAEMRRCPGGGEAYARAATSREEKTGSSVVVLGGARTFTALETTLKCPGVLWSRFRKVAG